MLALYIALLLASLGATSWLVERGACDATVSLAAGHGGHPALGDTEAPLRRRSPLWFFSIGSGGSCVSKDATANAFGVDSHAIGYPEVCT